MNRKQRRGLDRSGATASGFTAAEGPDKLADVFAAAVRSHHSGALAEAERLYRHILASDPNHAETQSRLGAVLMAQGKTSEAIIQLERATALDPELFEAFGNLAQAYLATGQDVKAVQAAYRALELRETTPGKTLFARCAHNAVFRTDRDGRARKLMLRALLEDWAPPRAITGAYLSLIKLNVGINDCIARVNSAWPTRIAATELLDLPGIAELSGDQLLRGLLERDPITDIGLERLLTNVRHAMLTLCMKRSEWNESLLEFFCAVARQCFLNEYVYILTESEAAQAVELQATLGEIIKAGDPVPTPWLVTVGAYFPLHALPDASSLCHRSWPQCVEALIRQQITEPAEERQIAAALPTLTTIEDEVSQAVRQQYEENPYPRWVTTVPPERTSGYDERSGPIPDVLIAGCGTGLSLVEMSRALVRARILAIDLSRASLSYAKRMAQKLGLNDIEFAQADILKLGSIGQEFDFIEASGVLHHLADPWQGWGVLLSLLRSGGTMNVGLYSDLARRNVVAARALITERGYRPIPQDIRRCRQDIIASDDPLLMSLIRSQDFHTTSECRDLLFHVQEVRITLPEIKTFLTDNNLYFGGFNLDAAILQKFTARFPGRGLADLDCWHAFETEAPDTFRGMYQFQVRKPTRPSDTNAA
jgi:2-polyprenyl-3-methyl-5-hydroxy-6-metoxy-1,4-benzoquinol methylase/tetratricopeptide (TPR) repeat protein